MENDLRGVVHGAPVVPQLDAAEAAHGHGPLAQKPVHGVNLLDADFADEAGRSFFPQAPVQFRLALGIRRGATPARLLVPLRAGLHVVARGTGADEREEKLALRIGAESEAGLEVGFHRVARGDGDGACVLDGVRERRFAIDVLARLQRRHRDLFVLMRGRGNEHGLHVLVLQNFFVVGVVGGLGRGFLRALLEGLGFVVVADGDDFRLRQTGERVENFPAPHIAADDRALDRRPIVSAARRRRCLRLGHERDAAEHGHGGSEGRGFQELAAREVRRHRVRQSIIVHGNAGDFVASTGEVNPLLKRLQVES